VSREVDQHLEYHSTQLIKTLNTFNSLTKCLNFDFYVSKYLKKYPVSEYKIKNGCFRS